jgi:hypothetical protein
MIFLVIAVISGTAGGFLARSKGKEVFLWAILCFFFPIAILILAFKDDEKVAPEHVPEYRPSLSAKTPAEIGPVLATAVSDTAWKTLKEFDADVQDAAAKVERFGPQAEERLASAYMSVKDKGLLPSIVAKIVADEEKEAIAREEEKARRAIAMSERDKEILADRESRAERTIGYIKEMGMVYDGQKVVSAEMYYGATVADQGWAKIVYESGKEELRAGSSWTLVKNA